jgi:hypothetical protein
MTVLAAIVLILLVATYIVWPLVGQVSGGLLASASPRDERWTREKAVAVLAITEADFDRATGKLSDDDYRILRTDYEGRALLAMDEIEKLQTALAAAGRAIFCGGCGSRLEAENRFCGSCGRPALAA